MTSETALTAPTRFLETSGVKFAYRTYGNKANRPVVLLNHLAANLDNWDPALLDRLAEKRTIITFDNAGIGSSSGNVGKSIEAMALTAAEFIKSIHDGPVDIIALSMGGMVAQEIAKSQPELINKLVLVGTGPRGGEGIERVTQTTVSCMLKAAATKSDPKQYIFFNQNEIGRIASTEYIYRLEGRVANRDKPVKISAFLRQLIAIHRFGKAAPDDLSSLRVPCLIINGDNDIMVPTRLSLDLAERIPNSQLEIYGNSGHGSLFQYPEKFTNRVMEFLEQ